MSAAESMVAHERRRGDRRSAWGNPATSFASGGNFSGNESDKPFPTTHAKARCEEQLIEAQAAAEHAADAVQRSIDDAERMLDDLMKSLRAAKAAQRAAHLAAGQISGAAR